MAELGTAKRQIVIFVFKENEGFVFLKAMIKPVLNLRVMRLDSPIDS